MADAFASVDVSIQAAGDSPLGAVGRIAIGYSQEQSPGADVAGLRSQLAAGDFNAKSSEKSSGVGSHADHSA